MSRGRVLALVAVLALLVGALLVGLRPGGGDDAPSAQAPATDLRALRAAAALPPCPAGLTPELPGLTLPCLGAEGDVEAAAAPGRPTLVNVWATWCPPCVREIPLLQSVAERSEEVQVVGVLTQDTPENGLRFAADPAVGGMTYASVVDEAGVVMRTYAPGPPVTLFVAADGDVVHVQVGEMTSQEQVDRLVAEHLGVTP